MSNPETESSNDRRHTEAAPAGANPGRRSTHEPRTPASREDREGAERGSREYNEHSQWGSRRSGMHPPRSLTMPHTDRSQEDTDQRRPQDFRSRGTPIYNNQGEFVMYDEPAQPLNYVPNTHRQSTDALMYAMQKSGIPTPHGGYPLSGYPLRQGGPCSESTSFSAPPQWRGGEEQRHEPTAREHVG